MNNLSIFKQSDGRYRWILFSSSAFKDRDDEIVSRQAQENDCAAMNATKQFGTLDWWHTPLIIGDCDFAAMHNLIRVESGLYRDEKIGAAMAAHQNELAASLAFFHPVNEPEQGVYKTIRTFSRALLPRGTESNTFTRLFVAEEETAMKEKFAALVAMLGGGKEAEDKVNAILQSAEKAEQVARADGVAFKAEGETKPEGDAPGVEMEVESPVAEDKPVEPEAKADAPDLLSALQELLAPLAAQIAALTETLSQHSGMMTEMQAGATKSADETKSALAAASKQLADAGKQITALETRVKQLEGEQPRAGSKPGFVASRDASTVTQQTKNAPTLQEGALATINQFILGGQPNN